MATLDFELEIGSGVAGSYPVLARAPSGEAAGTLRWFLTLVELDHQLMVIKDKVLVSSAVARRASTEDEQPVRELGQRLFEALIVDDVWALYVASRQRARENKSVLRLILRVRPPELARLPWEFLFDPVKQDYLGLTMPLVRYLDVTDPSSRCPSRRRCGFWAWSPARATFMHWMSGRNSSGCKVRWRACSATGW